MLMVVSNHGWYLKKKGFKLLHDGSGTTKRGFNGSCGGHASGTAAQDNLVVGHFVPESQPNDAFRNASSAVRPSLGIEGANARLVPVPSIPDTRPFVRPFLVNEEPLRGRICPLSASTIVRQATRSSEVALEQSGSKL